MAYESEKQRLNSLLSTATGYTRQYNTDLAREADERAYEGFLQVGIGPQPDGSFLGISHPTQMERESRLGPEWAGKGVAEIAVWFYGVNDPIAYAVRGWMGSPTHRAVLMDSRFKHIGLGIYAHLPSGDAEILRRWYIIAWLSIELPLIQESDMILVPIEVYPAGTIAQFKAFTNYSLYRVVANKIERKTYSSASIISHPAAAKVSLNGDTTYPGVYLIDGPNAGWVVSGWTPPTIVKPTPIVDRTAEVAEWKATAESLVDQVGKLQSSLYATRTTLASEQERLTAKDAKADELKAI